MSLLNDLETRVPWYDRLFEPVYRVKDAARYSGVHPNTVARWLRVGDIRWKDRAPGLPLSYLELVDTAFATYFRRMGIPFNAIRDARRLLSDHFESPYPFVEIGFKTDGSRILTDGPPLAVESDVVPQDALYMVIHAHTIDFSSIRPISDGRFTDSNSLPATSGVWFELIAQRSSEFDYDYNVALTWYPAGRNSFVKIDPRMSFGEPAVNGVLTGICSPPVESYVPTFDVAYLHTRTDFLQKRRFKIVLTIEGINRRDMASSCSAQTFGIFDRSVGKRITDLFTVCPYPNRDNQIARPAFRPT